ncbi:hypothetical protein BMMON3_14920 [Burkholderia mallei]
MRRAHPAVVRERPLAGVDLVAAIGRELADERYWYAAFTIFTRSRALDTFWLDRPVEFSKCVSVMPSDFAFAFIAAMNAGRPPG